MPQGTVNSENSSVSVEEVRAELDAILHSPGFERSEKLQRFLRYVCELTLQGESSKLNEYLIGSEVFQRGADYSPTEDSVVRRQAHTLRQKLHEYYASNGRQHTVRIELPVGRYVPVFRRRQEEFLPIPANAPDAVSKKRWIQLGSKTFAVVLGSIILFAGGWALGRKTALSSGDRSTSAVSRAAQEIWGNWLATGNEAVICLSNPLTAVIQHFPRPLPMVSVPIRGRASGDLEKLLKEFFKFPAGGNVYVSPAMAKSNTGEAIAAVHLTRLFSRAGGAVRVTQSRFLGWEDLRRDNLIVLGHSDANQWADRLLNKYPLQLAKTSENTPRSIVNTRPAPGEPSSYHITYSDKEGEGDQEYALVSMLPGVQGSQRLLLISGLNTQATQIATEYLTTESTLEQLLAKLREADPAHRGLWHFQAVLKTEVHDKVPMKASLVALRLL